MSERILCMLLTQPRVHTFAYPDRFPDLPRYKAPWRRPVARVRRLEYHEEQDKVGGWNLQEGFYGLGPVSGYGVLKIVSFVQSRLDQMLFVKETPRSRRCPKSQRHCFRACLPPRCSLAVNNKCQRRCQSMQQNRIYDCAYS